MVHWPIVIGLSFYVLITLLVGLYAGRRIKASADFIVAGRRLGIWLATGSLAATWFGGGVVIGAASEAYKSGFLGVIADPFGASLCLFLAGLFYVRMMRRMRLSTVSGFFEIRYGKQAGVIAALCTIPAYVGWVASLLLAFGKVIHAIVGLDPTVAICVGTAVVLIYTAAGGMWAVTLTDFLQVSVLIAGLVIIFPMLIHDMGGWTAIRSQIPDDRFFLFPGNASLPEWLGYVRDWMVIGLGNLAAQDLLQRSLSSRSESVAQNSAYLAGLLYVTVGLLPVFLGISATLIYPELQDPDLVMMKLGMHYLSPVWTALFLGALVSALMSSADSGLLAPAGIIGSDLLRYLRPGISEARILSVCRLSVPVLGLVALYLALAHNVVYTLMVDSWSILLATLFVPMTAGLWWPRANTPGALASILSGLITWVLILAWAPHLPADLLAVPVALCFLVFFSRFTTQAPRPLTDTSGKSLEFKDRIGLLGWKR